jgi:hypothetical protein
MDRYKRNCGRLVQNGECFVLRWHCIMSKWFRRWYIGCMDFVTCLIFWKYDNILVNRFLSILQWSLVLSNQAIWVALSPFQLCMETYFFFWHVTFCLEYQMVTRAQIINNNSKPVDVDYVNFVFLIFVLFPDTIWTVWIAMNEWMNDELEEM